MKWNRSMLPAGKLPLHFLFLTGFVVGLFAVYFGRGILLNRAGMLGGDIGTAVTRALLSVPSHAIDGVIMGYFFGVAKEAELAGDKKRRKRYLKLSVFMPMIEHGIYDSALSLDADWIFVFFFLFVIVVDVWAYKFVKKQSGQDRELSA